MKKSAEFYLAFLIMLLITIMIVYFGARFLGEIYYENKFQKQFPLTNIKDHYQKEIEIDNRPYQLAKKGLVFLKIDYNDLAWQAFQKACQLEPNWRDGWLWKGYTELKNGQFKPALESLKIAEKLDPIYPPTYQLLTIAYQKTGDEKSAQFTREKFEYLSKTYPKN